MTTNDATNTPVDPRNPARKYYSGIASMTLAIASIFVLLPLLSAAGIATGIVAIVTGGKIDDRKLRGEGWIGTVLSSLIFLAWLFVGSGM